MTSSKPPSLPAFAPLDSSLPAARGDSFLVLQDLRIPLGESIPVVVEDDDGNEIPGDAGVNIALMSSGAGLMVIVEPYLNMAFGDELYVFWSDRSVAAVSTIVERDQVDKPVDLQVPPASISNGQAAVWYRVRRISGAVEDSDDLQVLVKLTRPGGEDPDPALPGHQNLAAPEVPVSVVLPEHGINGLDITLPPYPEMRVRDLITLRWGELEVRRQVLAQEVGRRVVIHVEGDVITQAGDAPALSVAYKVRDEVQNESRDGIGQPWSETTFVRVEVEAQLFDAPSVLEASGDYLDPAQLPSNHATVKVDHNGVILAGDRVTCFWVGEVSGLFSTWDVAGGGPSTSLLIYLKDIAPNLGSAVVIYYRVERGGVRIGTSHRATLNIGPPTLQKLTVSGGRSDAGPFYHANPRRLEVLDASATGTIYWQYSGRPDIRIGPAFLDVCPERELTVIQTEQGQLDRISSLRPRNVVGIGGYSTVRSGCLVKNDGTVFAWNASGEIAPPPQLARVHTVAANLQAYAAIHSDGQVTCWGSRDAGGLAPPGLSGVVVVACSGRAFIALRGDGSVVTWGDPLGGGLIPPLIAPQLHAVTQVIGSNDAFAVLREDGEVFCWGGEQWPYGMHVHAASDSQRISASGNAFAALTSQRTVVAWGLAADGGSIPAELAAQLTNVQLIVSTSSAFAAMTGAGKVLAWGDPRFGGQLPAAITNAKHVVGSTTAFAAQTLDDRVVGWGLASEGANIPANLQASYLTAGYGSFAAIRPDGSAISWGVVGGEYIGNDSRALYEAGGNFIVLTGDEKVIAWGLDNLDLQHLDGQLTQLVQG